jgi:hypothetical protein
MERIFNTAAFFYMILAFQARAAVFYVNVSNTVPIAPYATWATAAGRFTNI